MIASMQSIAFAAAGIHTFKGDLKVIDSITGEEIPDVSISLVDQNHDSAVKYTQTIGSSGKFKITNIAPGEYGWVLTVGGYTPSKMKTGGMFVLKETQKPQVKDLGKQTVAMTEKGKSPGDAEAKLNDGNRGEEDGREANTFGAKVSALTEKFTSKVAGTFKSVLSVFSGDHKASAAADEDKEQGASISGSLYSADSGEKITGDVSLYKEDGSLVTTDQVGIGEGYSFPGLKAGKYTVMCSAANNFSPAQTIPIEITEKDAAAKENFGGKDLYLGAKGMKNGVLSGKVTVGDLPGGGTPTDDPVEVKLLKNGNLVKPVECSADGSYVLTDIPAGTYALEAGGFGYVTKTVVVQIKGGESLCARDLHVESVKELSSIEIMRLPDQRVYEEGELLDTTGMIVMAHYTDGTSKELENYDISGYGLDLGENVITVSYTEGEIEKEAIFMVEVIPKEDDEEEDDNNGGGNNNNGGEDNPNPPANNGTDGTVSPTAPNTAAGGNNNGGAGGNNADGAAAGGANANPMGAGVAQAADGTTAAPGAAGESTDPTAASTQNGEIDKAVQTSDESHVDLFWTLLAVCGATMLITLLTGRKKKVIPEE